MTAQSLNIAECMRFAREKKGKSLVSQFMEIFSLSGGLNKISPEDYYYYRLYDDSLYDKAAKKRFLSDHAYTGINKWCCDLHWWGLGDDKLLAYTLLKGFGAPLPEIYAVFHPFRVYAGAAACRTVEDLVHFLKTDARYPFFAKPARGVQSVGVSSVDSYEADTDSLILSDGRSIGVGAYANHLDHYEEDGYIIQERLLPHPTLQQAIGDRLTTIRVLVLVEDSGPAIVQTVWKITTGDNIADNFWRPGNMLAAVDAGSGEVTRVVQGVGPQQVERDDHPDTGNTLTGLVLPDWEKLRALCVECAALLPRLQFQSWDVALCPDGPVIVEANTGSAFNLPQAATGEGFLSERFAAFIKVAREQRRRERQHLRHQVKRSPAEADL